MSSEHDRDEQAEAAELETSSAGLSARDKRIARAYLRGDRLHTIAKREGISLRSVSRACKRMRLKKLRAEKVDRRDMLRLVRQVVSEKDREERLAEEAKKGVLVDESGRSFRELEIYQFGQPWPADQPFGLIPTSHRDVLEDRSSGGLKLRYYLPDPTSAQPSMSQADLDDAEPLPPAPADDSDDDEDREED